MEVDDQNPFSALKKGFLLRKAPELTTETAEITRPQPLQNHNRNALTAGEPQAKPTYSDEILQDIRNLRDLYGQTHGRIAQPIPFNEASKLFQKIEEWTRRVRVADVYDRVETAVKTIKKVVDRLESRWKEDRTIKSYAQAARNGNVGAPPLVHLREEKRVIIRITDKEEVDIIKK